LLGFLQQTYWRQQGYINYSHLGAFPGQAQSSLTPDDAGTSGHYSNSAFYLRYLILPCCILLLKLLLQQIHQLVCDYRPARDLAKHRRQEPKGHYGKKQKGYWGAYWDLSQ